MSTANDTPKTRSGPLQESATGATPSRVASAPFHAMSKPAGSVCNLGCSYCFYLEKVHLYQGTGAHRMSPQVVEAYVRDYIAAQPGSEVHFTWQGGEPTVLGLEFFREAIALQQRHANGKTIHNSFQTNGILLDDAWAEFLAEHRFLVGLSIDGPREFHDAYRVDKGGRPTFDRVIAALELLRKHRVDFNTLTTVHRKNSRQPLEVYRFLKRIGSTYLQFIPIVERAAPPAGGSPGLWLAPPPDHPAMADNDEPVTEWSVRPGDYGEFLCRIFDEWVAHDVGQIFVQQFDAALANWVGEAPGICVFSKNCGRAVALEHNGDVYSCDHYVYPEYRLGNVLQDGFAALVDSPRQRQFGEAKSASLPRYCRECPVEFACHGECPKHRFMTTPDGEPGLNYLCPSYRRFFTHIDAPMRTMGAMLRSGQAPAAIMQLPRAQWLRKFR